MRWPRASSDATKATHRIKLSERLRQHRTFAVYHVEKGKGIPPFLVMYVTKTSDTARRRRVFGAVLK